MSPIHIDYSPENTNLKEAINCVDYCLLVFIVLQQSKQTQYTSIRPSIQICDSNLQLKPERDGSLFTNAYLQILISLHWLKSSLSIELWQNEGESKLIASQISM